MRLVFEQVGVAYGATRVVCGVDLTVEAGEVVALVGPNGSGKSSLVRAAAGLLRHDGGIRFEGGARIGYMPQEEGRRPALTALEVVLLGRIRGLGFRVPDAELAAAVTMMEELGVARLSARLVGELSGGQRQLVYLAQALVAAPEALLLDEPTSALDLRHQLDVLSTVRRMARARGFACLIVLHDLNAAARFADRIAVLHEGGLACCATPDAALTARRIATVFGVEAAIGRAPDGRPTITPIAALA